MLTITISARAAALLLSAAALLPLYATDALGSGDVPDEVLQGDINCDGLVDFQDGLGALRYEAGLPVDQNEPCFAPGSVAAIPGPPGPQGPVGTQGPPGVNLYANVTIDGAVRHGNAVDATRISTGGYVVTFPQDVTTCAPIVTVGGAHPTNAVSAAFTFGTAHVNSFGAEPEEVSVSLFTRNDDTSPVDSEFHLIVVC